MWITKKELDELIKVNLLKQELDFRIEIAQMSSEIRRLKTELGLEKFRRSVRGGKNEG